MPHFCIAECERGMKLKKVILADPSEKGAKTGVLFGPNAQYLLEYGGFAHIWIPPKGEFTSTNGFQAAYNAVG